jgi:hypothetical protein
LQGGWYHPAFFLDAECRPHFGYFALGVHVQIIDNKALLITTKKYDQIINLIPKSKLIDQRGDVGRVLVHWGFDEARLLRKFEGSAMFSPVEDIRSRAFVCTNDTAGTVYILEPILGSGNPPVIECAQ